MNKRVKELAEQAWQWANNQVDIPKPQIIRFEEKFAELIIKDCLDVVATRMNLGTVELCRQECKALTAEIKHHFDVEE